MQQAVRDQILSHTQVFQWHVQFKTGHTSFDDDEHTGIPTSCTTSETVTQIQELVCQDCRQTIHNIAEKVGIGYGTCEWVLMKEMGMHCVAAKFAPRILRADQKHPAVSGEIQNGCHPLPIILP
jgi:hypothetical protein